ncbi:hypothetical protein JHK82_044730 [Glycine max]|nr:hypothetical protein JHK82_044730 [Glycine max]
MTHFDGLVVYKSKGETKDIELVEEEQARIGADSSSETSNKSENYKEEARNATQKHKPKRVESVNADAEAFGDDWKTILSMRTVTPDIEAYEDIHILFDPNSVIEPSPSTTEIKTLTITSDTRPMILLEKFSFTHTGNMSISVSSIFVVASGGSQPNPS